MAPQQLEMDDSFSFLPPSALGGHEQRYQQRGPPSRKSPPPRTMSGPMKSYNKVSAPPAGSAGDHLKYMFQAHQQEQLKNRHYYSSDASLDSQSYHGSSSVSSVSRYHQQQQQQQQARRRVSYNTTINETHAIIDDVLNIVGYMSDDNFVDDDDDMSILTEATTLSKMIPSSSSSSRGGNRAPPPRKRSNIKLKGAASSIKKSVSFVPKAKVVCVLHIQDYTNDELRATWYTQDDMKNIQKEIRDIVTAYKKNPKECYAKYGCLRGLECRFPYGQKQRSNNKRSSRNAVINEQKKQKEDFKEYGSSTRSKSMKHLDANQIALVYMLETRHCGVAAHEIALEDQEEVHKMNSSKEGHGRRSMHLLHREDKK